MKRALLFVLLFPLLGAAAPEPETYAACLNRVEKLVADLQCETPRAILVPRRRKQLAEYALQSYARTERLRIEDLNALVLLADEDRRPKMTAFFQGLECAGRPGDTERGRKNWRWYLPQCPASPPKDPWVRDPQAAVNRFHNGASSCWRLPAEKPRGCTEAWWKCTSGKWLEEQPKALRDLLEAHPAAQQCCYDGNDRLVNTGESAGTPDMIYSRRVIEDLAVGEPAEAMDEEKTFAQRSAALAVALKDRFKDGRADARAALHHNVLDARIIAACFSDWPGKDRAHVATYHQLGWGPGTF